MTTPELLTAAARALASQSNQPNAIKAAAVEALVTLLSEGIQLPPEAIRDIWRFWRVAPNRRAVRSASVIGAIPDDLIHSEAMEVLLRGDSEPDLRELAADILTGDGHRAHLPDEFLTTLVERAVTESAAREVGRLLEVAHGSRGMPVYFLWMVRDRFGSSPIPSIREVAILLDALAQDPDIGFLDKMLNDPDVDVRIATANAIGFDHPARWRCVPSIEERLQVEVHPRARAALMHARAALLDDDYEERRRSRRRR